MGYITIEVENVVLGLALFAAVYARLANDGAWSARNEVRELRHELHEADVIDESPYAAAYEVGENDDEDGDED